MTVLTPHQTKALEFKDHLSLTANAGSGKTFVLARRYLNAALTPGVSLSNIAAITFTEKAAGELYNKIVKLVTDQIQVTESVELKNCLEKIRRQLVSANISTIHSFCISILKEFPVEAGLDARFVPIDEQLSEELIELSIEDTLKKLLENESESEKIKYLIRILGSKNRLGKELFNLIRQRKNLLIIKDSIYSKNDSEIFKFLIEQFDNYFMQIWKGYRNDLINSLEKINKAVLDNNSGNETANILKHLLTELKKTNESLNVIKILTEVTSNILTKSGTLRIQEYLVSNLRKGFEFDILYVQSVLSELSKIKYSQYSDTLLKDLVKFSKTILEIFDFTIENYHSRKNNEGYLDYEDILLYTKELLKLDSVQKSLSAKFKYILVDEYQDTNEIQYEIFLPILDYLKLGNLFIVGDEKQSIYMFRDAELEIFNRTKVDISRKAGKNSLLELPDSFRMAPEICLFTNELFQNLFRNPNELFNEVHNTNIVCARSDKKPGKVEIILSDSREETSLSESELITRRIIELKNSGVNYKDIAVLVRKRKSFSQLETLFIKNSIPFSIIGGRGFYQRQTVSDIYNYLSFLSNSGNDVALTGVLRSPFFCISDSVLFEISLQSGSTFWRKFQKYSEGKDKLIKVKNLLNENILLASSLDMTLLLRKILSDTDYLAVISSRIDGKQELANIDKLLNISRSFSLKGFRNLYDFIDYLNDSIINVEDESQAALSSDTDAVQMMTLHQAKGLEFPVVILVNAHESSQKTLIRSGQISISKKFGLLTKLPLNEDYLSDYHTTPLNGLFNFIEEKKRIAELKRLLYVGITRAMDHLIISGDFAGEKLKEESFLYLITSGLGIKPDQEFHTLSGELEFLINKNSQYSNERKTLTLNIPIKHSIEIDKNIQPDAKEKLPDPELKIERIEAPLEKDIISATKVAVYSQCPVKYLLTYEYGFGKINTIFNQNKNLITEPESGYTDIAEVSDIDSAPLNILSTSKGSLIHYLLEKNMNADEAEQEVSRYLMKQGLSDDQIKHNKHIILSEYTAFIQSDIYKTISKYKNYKNELQLYLKDEEIFLFGIPDKIIYSENELIIVDYKTDDISEDEIEKRAENYLIQLKFYMFLAQKLFVNYDSFRLILIFIRHPQKPLTKKYNIDEFFLVKREISDIIKGIINKNFVKNTDHCGICVYSNEIKQCIMK